MVNGVSIAHFNVQFFKIPTAHWLQEFRKQLSENEGDPTCAPHGGCCLKRRLTCLLIPCASIWLHPPRLGEQSDGPMPEWLCSLCAAPASCYPCAHLSLKSFINQWKPRGLCVGTLLLATLGRDLDTGLG